uniref:Rab proteins geranylgeranyltransferase component A n=1 Tax=Culex tarsalis TaxID=7177 RepID=A0A1Q3FC76_CULTA
MDEDLPTEFDLIVVGTGLSESIVAAAASRIGKTVLHLDSNEYYGGFWSSFNLEALRKYVEECREQQGNQLESSEKDQQEGFLPLTRATFVENVAEEWFQFEEDVDVDGWNREKILKEFRRFNVDLAPKLLYSRGSMVELLISSNICRYAEFRAVDRVATIWNGRIMTVPCSRSDVFTSRDVNVVEKRLLMKFLQSCASFETDGSGTDEHRLEDIEGKTFLEYLKSHKLTPNLIHYLLYTIAMGNDRTSCRQGLEGVKKFLLSLGRYGNSPFLFPMYGCGEIPQCFCRLCAVFGGIYCLSKSIEGINFKHSEGERSFQSLRCGKQTIEAKNLVIGQGYVSTGVFLEESKKQDTNHKGCGKMARGVFLTNVPLGGASQNTGGGGVSLMKLPPVEGHKDGATIIQLAHFSGTCPKEIYLIHITARAISDDPQADLEPYVKQILSREAPKPTQTPADGEIYENTQENTVSTILYQLYFTIPACVSCNHGPSPKKLPRGLHLACGPLLELDYDESIARAQQIFKDIYPEEEFLPRAPDPEQIIIGDEEDQPQPEQAQEAPSAETAPVDKVESGRECRESESSSSVPVTPSGGVPLQSEDAQEAKEDAVEKAEECVEQK